MSRKPRPRPRRRAAVEGRKAARRSGRRAVPGAAILRSDTLRRGALVLAVLAGLVLMNGALEIWGPGPRAKAGASPTTVVLRPGEGVGAIAHDLAAAHVVSSPTLFVVAAEVLGAAPRLKAGEYAFAPGASLARVIAAIREGAVVRRFLTVPEGLASVAVTDLLAADPVLVGPTPPLPEGSILPETYEVRRGEARAEVVLRMRQARDRLLDELWRDRAPGLPFRTPEEAVVLASVVEKETALAAERPRVAAVFINRLERGMRLGSDPTVIYGLTGGRPLGHGLTVSELARPTPYNTYRTAGLPPTPIANPGRAALAATLRPATTQDLYFVADGTGGHAFAATLDAHERNVARWRSIERTHSGRAPA